MKDQKQFNHSIEFAAMQLIVAYHACGAPNGFSTIIERAGQRFELTFKRIEPKDPSEAHLKKT